jgi:hypothetical protein
MRWAGVVAWAWLAALTSVTDPVFASSARQVGLSFFNNGDRSADRLSLSVFNPPDKAAGLVADTNRPDNQSPVRLVVLFTTKDEWAKLASIWAKARHAKRPTNYAEEYSDAADMGSYFDPDENTMASVSVDKEGGVDFTVAGEPDAEKKPTVFAQIRLKPGDFKAFDKDIKTISAYFAK